MYLSNRLTFLAGLAMVLLALTTVATVALNAAAGIESDPFQRSEAPQYLEELAANKDAMIAAGAVGLVSDSILVPIVAVMFFLLFRNRSVLLASIAFAGILTGGIISTTNGVLGIVLTYVADDFVTGGPGTEASLEVGRFLGMLNFSLFAAVTLPYGLGLTALGLTIALAPREAINPPRLLGGVALTCGAASLLAPLALVNDVFFVLFPIQLLTSLIVLVGLGGWLLLRGEHLDHEAPAATPAPAGI